MLFKWEMRWLTKTRKILFKNKGNQGHLKNHILHWWNLELSSKGNKLNSSKSGIKHVDLNVTGDIFDILLLFSSIS